jgi:hypothetical protein
MPAIRKTIKAARRAGAAMIEPDLEPGEVPVTTAGDDDDLTITEERQRIARVALHHYRDQLVPWKVFFGAMAGGLYMHNAHWSPIGALVWTVFLAGGAYAYVDWRLAWRHVGGMRFEWRNPTGSQLRRIKKRARRAAWCAAWTGVWLIAVTITTPGTRPGDLVWMLGAAAWATVSYHGWWRPADQVVDGDFTADPQTIDAVVVDEPDTAPITPSGPITTPAPATAQSRPVTVIPVPRAAREAGIPSPAPAEMPHPKLSLPDTSLLKQKADPGVIPPGEDRTAAIQAVFDERNVRARVVEAVRSPSITRYGVELASGEMVTKVMRLKQNIAYACGTGAMRMLAPIEGQSLIGIEVPNTSRDPVTLGEVLASREARLDSHPLQVALGKDTDGNYRTINLAKMPHILLAGASGGGKSGGLNAFLASLLTRATPDELQLILIDPKQVELVRYNGIPHLAMRVVTKPDVAIYALQWVEKEAENRYDVMAKHGVRNIDDFNTGVLTGKIKARPGEKPLETLPYLGVFVDELLDLMMLAGDEVEESVVRIAAIARAAGVHLVLATQRPAAEVVTNKIKANVPARIAYKTSSQADSRVIIDKVDAAKLLGKGDMYFKDPETEVLVRIQGAWVSDEEVEALIKYWRTEGAAAGLTVPEIDLAVTAADQQQNAGPERVTARDIVFAAAARHADEHGEVEKAAIVAATPTVGEKSRDAALTRLVAIDKKLKRIHQGRYQVLAAATPEEEETP